MFEASCFPLSHTQFVYQITLFIHADIVIGDNQLVVAFTRE